MNINIVGNKIIMDSNYVEHSKNISYFTEMKHDK